MSEVLSEVLEPKNFPVGPLTKAPRQKLALRLKVMRTMILNMFATILVLIIEGLEADCIK
mgnify:CR=1 FL=1